MANAISKLIIVRMISCSPVNPDELHQRFLCASDRPERKEFKAFQTGELRSERKFDCGKSFAFNAKIRSTKIYLQ